MIYLSRIQTPTIWQKVFKLIFSDKDFFVIEKAEPDQNKGHLHRCSQEH